VRRQIDLTRPCGPGVDRLAGSSPSADPSQFSPYHHQRARTRLVSISMRGDTKRGGSPDLKGNAARARRGRPSSDRILSSSRSCVFKGAPTKHTGGGDVSGAPDRQEPLALSFGAHRRSRRALPRSWGVPASRSAAPSLGLAAGVSAAHCSCISRHHARSGSRALHSRPAGRFESAEALISDARELLACLIANGAFGPRPDPRGARDELWLRGPTSRSMVHSEPSVSFWTICSGPRLPIGWLHIEHAWGAPPATPSGARSRLRPEFFRDQSRRHGQGSRQIDLRPHFAASGACDRNDAGRDRPTIWILERTDRGAGCRVVRSSPRSWRVSRAPGRRKPAPDHRRPPSVSLDALDEQAAQRWLDSPVFGLCGWAAGSKRLGVASAAGRTPKIGGSLFASWRRPIRVPRGAREGPSSPRWFATGLCLARRTAEKGRFTPKGLACLANGETQRRSLNHFEKTGDKGRPTFGVLVEVLRGARSPSTRYRILSACGDRARFFADGKPMSFARALLLAEACAASTPDSAIAIPRLSAMEYSLSTKPADPHRGRAPATTTRRCVCVEQSSFV